MSTKIYNGFKFKDSDFRRIHEQMEELRAFIKVDAKIRTIDYLRERVVKEFDMAASRNLKLEPRLVGRLSMDLWDRQRKIVDTKRRDPEVDFSFSIVILIDPKTDAFYGLFYTEQKDWELHVQSMPWFVDYSYWNNTDRPTSISKEEWEERSQTWERVVGWSPPSQRGYTFEVETHLYFTDEMVDQLLDPNKLPSIEQRIRNQALSDAVDFYFHQHYIAPKSIADSLHAATKVLMASRKWCTTAEGKSFIERRESDLSTVIKPITKELVVD